jgi:predicted amidohydrolase YtcJ
MDLIAHNGKVITLDAASRVVDAVAVRDGRFVGVGGGAELLRHAGPQTTVIDLKGRAVVPGLIDGHAHLDREGLRSIYPSLAGCRSIDDILQRIAELVRAAEPGAWVVTMPIGEPPFYWDVPECLAEKRWPTRHDLDTVAPNNPVFIRPVWGYWRHDFQPLISVANTKALQLCGITRDTPPPASTVEIQKDTSGEPTGLFLERTLIPMVELTLLRASGGFTHADRVKALRESIDIYHATGTTSVFEGHGVAPEVIGAYQALHADGALTMRADLVFSPSWGAVRDVPFGTMLDGWARWIAGRGLGDDRLRVAGLFTEVIANAEENAVRARAHPYTGWAGFHYDQQLPKEKVVEVMVEAARRDIRIVTIGTNMLPSMDAANRIEPIRDKRWVLSHIGPMSAAEIALTRDLGLVTSTNTNRNIYKYGSQTQKQLGERAGDNTPLQRLKAAGIPFSLATDNVPTSLFYPVWEVVARKDRTTGELIAPDQALSREDALRAATINGAFLSMSEHEKGSIEMGKLGDFVVLPQDPLTCPEDDLKDLTADLTVVGGRIVHQRS